MIDLHGRVEVAAKGVWEKGHTLKERRLNTSSPELALPLEPSSLLMQASSQLRHVRSCHGHHSCKGAMTCTYQLLAQTLDATENLEAIGDAHQVGSSMLLHSTKPRPFLKTFPPCDMSSCCISRWLPSSASCIQPTCGGHSSAENVKEVGLEWELHCRALMTWPLVVEIYLEGCPEEAIHRVDCDPLLEKPPCCAGLAFCRGEMPALGGILTT